MKRERVIMSAVAFAGIVLFVLFLPLPHYVRCSFEVAPRDAVAVYAEAPGRITNLNAKVGDKVQGDQTLLMELESLPLQSEVVSLQGKRAEAQAELSSLRERSFVDRTAQLQIASANRVLEMIDKQLTEKQAELARTKIVAPATGVVLPAAYRPARGGDGRLPTWSGSILEEKNRSAVLAEGDQICFVGDPTHLEAVLVIDQGDFSLVSEKDPVALKLESYRGVTLHTHIDERSMVDMKITPSSLAAQVGGGVQTKQDASGNAVPMSTSYQARAFIDDPTGEFRMGMRGKARIFTGWTPLSLRIYRYVAKTFNFDL